jgi:microcystin-dependent protein
MPIPASFTDLDPNPNNNSPQGTENVGPNANGYIQALGAFIKQLANGGAILPVSALNMNGQKIANLAAGSTTSTSTDALTGAQVRALAYKVGEVRTWHGAIASITATWGAGWQLADGTNGTADLRDRFIVGAGATYAVNQTGGLSTNTLVTAQLPAHNHGVNDPSHTHGLVDFGHNHGINDPQHAHATLMDLPSSPGTGNFIAANHGTSNFAGAVTTQPSATGISINTAGTGISMNSASTGITTQNNGSGAVVENKPPFYALCYLEYTGISA